MLLFGSFQIKGYRAEAVVAGDHRTVWIFHPTVKEVAFAFCKRMREGAYAFPGAFAKPVGFLSVFTQKGLSYLNVASVRNRVFILFDQVVVPYLFHGGNFNGIHSFS